MDFNYININQICSVAGKFVTLTDDYKYKERKPKKGFFSKEEKEGFYEETYDGYIYRTIEQIEHGNNKFVKDRKVFYKPRIVVRMSNQDEYKKIFNSNQEMFEFVCNSPLSKLDFVDTQTSSIRREVLLEKYQGYPDDFRILLKKSLEVERNK